MDCNWEEKLQQWHEDNEFEKIIQALEGLPEEELNFNRKGQLVRALNNVERYQEALELLDETKADGAEDAVWQFRRGYALYGLMRYAEARDSFYRAEELSPGDEDALAFISQCGMKLAYPAEAKTFHSRVSEFWELFAEREAELREKLDHREDQMPAVQLISELLDASFEESYFEMGFNGEKYELILSPEGELQRLFRLDYWKTHAPEALFEHWNFIVGRPPVQNIEQMDLRMYDCHINAGDVLVEVETLEDAKLGLSVFSEKLLPLLQENENKAYALMTVLIDQCIGEVSAIRHIRYLDILTEREGFASQAIPLSALRQFILDSNDGDLDKTEGTNDLCNSFTLYEMSPRDDEERALREDVFIGNTCCIPIINEYYEGSVDIVEENLKEGVVFGFLYYNNDEIPQGEMVNFRAEIEDEITEQAKEFGQILGGATGNTFSYIDCICYDFSEFLNTAAAVMNKRDLEVTAFHVFRKDCGGVNLKMED